MNETSLQPLSFDVLQSAVSGTAAAFRWITQYQPACGPGEKVFPPTYTGGKYAMEQRRINGEVVPCVLLDSVQSQANRMEEALLQAYEARRLHFPLMVVDFARTEDGSPQDDPAIARIDRITTLDAPHRIADAIFRDSVLSNGTTILPFRDSAEGQAYEEANIRNATALFELCPTALLFGVWNSTSLRRGSTGSKFARVVVSEIIGVHALVGVRTSSRIDPLGIPSQIPIYDDGHGNWTLEETNTLYGNGKTPGRPSLINHGNVTPDVSESGGVTMEYALQTSVISLPGLRRLRFPGAEETTPARNLAARSVLCALALVALASQRETGCDLRSRCLLVPTESSPVIELVHSGAECQAFTLTAGQAIHLFTQAVTAARDAGLSWREEVILWPMQKFVDLIRAGRQVQAQTEREEA